MSNQIEKIDVTFKDIEANQLRILAHAEKMHMFIYEWIDHMREAVKYCTLNEVGYKVIEDLKTDFHESLREHGITDLFDQ